ncbi:MAG: hypothetical protein EAZ39_00280 [Oscillatoriales cyanobacterium]|uniref:hypothetical protein n=1 Tax=unclassified Microcoleus TaxID=2642155 RepID=UPI001D4F9717|nr:MULTISPECIES: hypothetical protein [unclassified Microcoleus]MCC3429672.1 hypothetical protein [Microcoleus sp. PH2017_04_SCI_O_A]MCC3509970.1 hypothetical protein [Microcoleus sp. PH2017_17_BER_D_A]MCC3630204.1 hypothetical protein [Microcoleus sp. PH2017_39_LGB_O_B]MCC3642282.1 hypothetical protein [Microcoleus sp. PH2017_33_LGB_O_A]TAF89403.1 MAG: hypothetical protein EAZ49_12755 [Oscillatoriales cyanobacterium]
MSTNYFLVDAGCLFNNIKSGQLIIVSGDSIDKKSDRILIILPWMTKSSVIQLRPPTEKHI